MNLTLEQRVARLERILEKQETDELFGFGKKFGYKESEKFVKELFKDGSLSKFVRPKLMDFRKQKNEFYVIVEFIDQKKYRGNFLISGDGNKSMYCGYYINGGDAIKIMRNIDPLKDVLKIKKFIAEVTSTIARK